MRILFAIFLILNSALSYSNERKLNYFPRGKALVCINGNNQYTRALYGGYTDYRIETSDRPIFAVYKNRNYRNIRLYFNSVPLDSAEYCEASYECGVRSYVLRDRRWKGKISLSVVVSHNSEEAHWFLSAPKCNRGCDLKFIVNEINALKLYRNGDLGVDSVDAFSPRTNGKKKIFRFRHGTYFTLKNIDSLYVDKGAEYKKAIKYYSDLGRSVIIDTPDTFINTVGANLLTAADGIWDGKTWLHGAVGWRIPLPGWRAAYVGDVLGWFDRQHSHFDYYAGQQIRDVLPKYPHPMQDTTKNLARAAKIWGSQMYSNGYITSDRKLNHYDMNLVFVDELLWHFQYDADTVYMRKMWPVISSSLAWEKRNFDPDGDFLYDAYACIWASDALYYNGGAVTHSSAYNYRANLLAAKIADRLGIDSTPYKREAEGILNAMNKKLWLDKDGYWAEYKDLMGLKRVHRDAAVWSVYTPIDCGVGSRAQQNRATRYVDAVIPHIPVLYKEMKDTLYTISTSDWQPYAWSINNVACAEVMHTALAFFEAGRKDEGFRLMKANIIDNMYLGKSPANFGQLSYYDKARGESYRDFGDVIGISARTIIQGLFGIIPDALDGICYLRPSFPDDWKHASIRTPYLSYKYKKVNGKPLVYDIIQNFPQNLKIIVEYPQDSIGCYVRNVHGEKNTDMKIKWSADKLCREVGLEKYYNARVCNIFNQEYLSPRPNVTTLELPKQGIGDWCSTDYKPLVNDTSKVVFSSLWNNYPDSVTIPLNGDASLMKLTMVGTTNWMQSKIANGMLVVYYQNGDKQVVSLVNPDNWLPDENNNFSTDIYIALKRSKLSKIMLCTLSNDIVIGIKSITLQ